jgi:hypothetical protein
MFHLLLLPGFDLVPVEAITMARIKAMVTQLAALHVLSSMRSEKDGFFL